MISVIVPCYNSTPILEKMVEKTVAVLEDMGKSSYEFILVNDGSPHAETMPILVGLAEKYPFVKVIDLLKNTGQANAQLTALRYAQGDIIINMDDDMQTHPSNIPILLGKLEEGYDLVLGKYPEKKHNAFRRFLTRAEEKFAVVMLGKPKGVSFTSFWVIRKSVRDVMIQYDHPYAYLEGLFLRTTSNLANVEVRHYEREVGTSGYNFMKLLKLWSNFTSFTVLPLRIAGILGTVSAAVGFILACVVAVRKFLYPTIVSGYTSIMCMMLLLFGITMMFMGIMGEYIGRIFICINRAPQSAVRRTWNVENPLKGDIE